MTDSTQDALAEEIEAAVRVVRKFTFDGAGSNQARNALDRIVAALRAPNQQVEAVAWRYEIQHGPDGEAAYAWVFDDKNNMVCTAKTHHAEAIVRAVASPPSPQETRLALEAELPVTMLVDATVKLNGLLDRYWEGNNSKTQIIAMCASQQECKQAVELLAKAALSTSPAPAEDVRAAVIEECAKIAEQRLGGYLCPYGRDVPGDPTWDHRDSDKCPVCGGDGEESLHKCHDTVSGRIAAQIRSLTSPDPKQAMQDGGGDTARDNSTDHVDWDILAEERLGQRPRSEHGRHIPQTSPAPGCDSGSHSAQAIPSQIRAAP